MDYPIEPEIALAPMYGSANFIPRSVLYDAPPPSFVRPFGPDSFGQSLFDDEDPGTTQVIPVLTVVDHGILHQGKLNKAKRLIRAFCRNVRRFV